MTVLWMNLAIVYIVSLYSRYLATPAPMSVASITPNKIMAVIVIMSLALVAGLRNNIGDTFFYMHAYEIQDFNWEYILSEKDIGFGILQMMLKRISDDPQILIFITGVITNILIGIVLYRYSRLIELSIYVFITSGLYIISMNGIRQFLAAAILFTATKYLLEGNWIKYSLVVLLAASFHGSAIILIPIYFMVRRKAWTGTTIVFLCLAILFTAGYGQFSEVLFQAIEDSHYSEYKNFSEGGANILRVVVTAMPIVLAYLGREKLRRMFPQSDYIVNLSLLGVVFMIISTQNWIFARFYIYFGLYSIILISWVIKLFAEKEQKFIYYSILVCYLIYFYFENVISLHLNYSSHFIRI